MHSISKKNTDIIVKSTGSEMLIIHDLNNSVLTNFMFEKHISKEKKLKNVFFKN